MVKACSPFGDKLIHKPLLLLDRAIYFLKEVVRVAQLSGGMVIR